MWIVLRSKRSINNILKKFETKYSCHRLKVQPKKRELNEKDTFIDLIDIFDNCNMRTEELEGNFMFNISSYDEPFYIMIENLFLL